MMGAERKPTEAQRQVEKLHAEVQRWFEDATKLEQQGKRIPAATMRRRMQSIGWRLNLIERTMRRDNP